MRIFLSYGHDSYASLASRIKRDLEEKGDEVWFDVERLKPGGDWERYIEDGLDWSSAVPGEGRFLLLLTPHSVRRPDGYCLNELARAYGRSLPIIPVMVSTVEVPLSICRLQWLDMRPCFPVEQHEERYAKQFEHLVTAPLSHNARHERLTRSGIRNILHKYVVLARSKCPSLNRTVSPHTLRHTKGMHLLQSGVSLDMIRDFLGHVDAKTTQIYAWAILSS